MKHTLLWLFLISSYAVNAQNLFLIEKSQLAEFKSYGSLAYKRLSQWQQFIQERGEQNLTEQQKLSQVNHYVNQSFRYVREPEGENDYLSLYEFLIQGYGDCEDYAIAKFVGLISLGINPAQLRFAYVREVHSGEAHLILLYKAEEDELVLDNLNDKIMTLSERTDLKVVLKYRAQQMGLFKPEKQTDKSVATRYWKEFLVFLEHQPTPGKID